MKESDIYLCSKGIYYYANSVPELIKYAVQKRGSGKFEFLVNDFN